MELLLGKADRAGSDVLVAVEADLLENGGERPDLHFTVVHGQLRRRAAGERLQHFDADREVGVRVVVDLDRPHVRLLLFPIEAIDMVLHPFVEIDRLFVQKDLSGKLVHLPDHAGAAGDVDNHDVVGVGTAQAHAFRGEGVRAPVPGFPGLVDGAILLEDAEQLSDGRFAKGLARR